MLTMSKKIAGDVEDLLHRARVDSLGNQEITGKENRYIYNGSPTSGSAGYAIRPNKRAARRKVSTFNIILVLFGCALAIILYISNIIAVNQLAVEVNQLQAKYDRIENVNAVLSSEISRKSGWDRIGKIAIEQLGLKYPSEQATRFDIDMDELEKIQSRE